MSDFAMAAIPIILCFLTIALCGIIRALEEICRALKKNDEN